MTPAQLELAAAVVAEARSWIGTPVKHQGRRKGVGADCLGLIEQVGLATGALPALPADYDGLVGGYYGRLPNPRRLVGGLDRFLAPVGLEDERRSSDVLLLSWGVGQLPMHLAILADHAGRPTMIHAHAKLKPVARVVEHGFAAEWPLRLRGVYRFPALAGDVVAPTAALRAVGRA